MAENINTIGRETVANWMILRGYATGDGDTIQDLLFELEAQLGGPKELPPGEGDFRLLQDEIERLYSEGKRLADWIEQAYGALPSDHPPGPSTTLVRDMRASLAPR